jgi:hypothetical protein
MTRSFFLEVGGFDESLETGEDFEFSHRAARAGGEIAPDPQLVAEHLGFPHTLRDFVRREAWHGKSDFTSVRAILGSRVALAALFFALAHLAVLMSALLGRSEGVLLGLAAILVLCAASARLKYRKQPWAIQLANTGLYYLYYLGRALSPWQAWSARAGGRKRS